MSRFSSILDITADQWLDAMGLSQSDVPDAVIVEGSWWRAERTKWRLSYLDEVRELDFPDIFWGTHDGKKIAFCCAYGAARTSEVIHLFGAIGTPLAIQIGTCGGIQPHLGPGDIILPEVAIGRDGVSALYGATEPTTAAAAWIGHAQELLTRRGLPSYKGTHITWPALFTETADLVDAWGREGYLSVDMETAATFGVARCFGMSAVSLLVVWDDLTRGRNFLDALEDNEQKALQRGNTAVYEVALALATKL